MSDIPEDIQKAASTVCFLLGQPDRKEVDTTIVARALTAERERCAQLEAAAKELAEYASYAEITGGIGVNRQQIRTWCDHVFAAIRKGAP